MSNSCTLICLPIQQFIDLFQKLPDSIAEESQKGPKAIKTKGYSSAGDKSSTEGRNSQGKSQSRNRKKPTEVSPHEVFESTTEQTNNQEAPPTEVPKTFLDYFYKEGSKYRCTICPGGKGFNKTAAFKHSLSRKHSTKVNYKRFIEQPSAPVKEALEQTLTDMNMSRYGRKVIKNVFTASVPARKPALNPPEKTKRIQKSKKSTPEHKSSEDERIGDSPKQRVTVKNPFLKSKGEKRPKSKVIF